MNYDDKTLAKLVGAVLSSKLFKQKLKTILRARVPADLDEQDTCKFLYAILLLVGNGQRAGTITNMVLKEFNRAKVFEGREVVKVAQHKTGEGGPATIVFAYQKTWKAVHNFLNIFR